MEQRTQQLGGECINTGDEFGLGRIRLVEHIGCHDLTHQAVDVDDALGQIDGGACRVSATAASSRSVRSTSGGSTSPGLGPPGSFAAGGTGSGLVGSLDGCQLLT